MASSTDPPPNISAPSTNQPVNALFRLGNIVATPAALELLTRNAVHPRTLIERHVLGDWTDMDTADRRSNLEAVTHGYRVFSSFNISATQKLWIITEADRSCTTLLVPTDY